MFPVPHKPTSARAVRLARLTSVVLLLTAAVFFLLHFLHLDADFPNHSPWRDWSKYTDEGWYGDAAIRHYLSGHWYFPGDFNPAVALPVWPALEWMLFRFTGVSTYAVRGLTVMVFGLTLAAFYALLERYSSAGTRADEPPALAGPLCVALLCLNPFVYVFERMAIVEPLLIALAALAMLVASHLREFPHLSRRSQKRIVTQGHLQSMAFAESGDRDPVTQLRRDRLQSITATLALALLMPAMVLTKTTAVALLPAVFYMVWASAGYRLRPFLRLLLPPLLLGGAIWTVYFFGVVHRGLLEDYRYIFSANAYIGVGLYSIAAIVVSTVADGTWMGQVLYPAAFVLLALALFWRPRVWTNPLLPALLLWVSGYLAFIGYHTNLQPRYYLVIAVPLTAGVALLLDELPRAPGGKGRIIFPVAAGLLALCMLVPDAIEQIGYVRHPSYEFRAAAEGVKRVVLADRGHSHLVLSISGSDLTLMTGLPSINDDFGTLDLDQRVAQYRPGWYAAWNELDDDKADALSGLYQPVRVAAFPALDDPDRNLLILYRLDPKSSGIAHHRAERKPSPPKQLRTKIGQQPTTTQLVH